MTTPTDLPIDDPEFWRRRIASVVAHDEPMYLTVYNVGLDRWNEIRKHHIRALYELIKPDDSVLDAGCAYGRLLQMMPGHWRGNYLGLDLSQDFVALAKMAYPQRRFIVGDLRQLSEETVGKRWTWAVLVSVDNMIEGSFGVHTWHRVLANLRRVADKILILSYIHPENPRVI